jgi:hypothetical protein
VITATERRLLAGLITLASVAAVLLATIVKLELTC